ncbi:RtcB family protein [Parabacteroides sp. PF5-6]|uniref:RtcB family protein n=1 Tax=Parabacteroides sp. PF5-6 TaxID=1742403 RepID=UPI002406A027|nr:RtcB family protein [Parabacteroides sp. PF5-6]MDF9831337.1 tRNA-splicing ligase RtcB [Parabacteroides sp. PF5-6]
MQQVISSEQIPIKMWLDNAEDGSIVQARNLANLPFAFKHICLMPDTYQGYGMPIGGVLATKGVVIPNAVGVDIGCGMCAVKTNISADTLSPETIKSMMKGIRERIPLGFDHRETPEDEALIPQGHKLDELPMVKAQYQSALKQLGTLGGGNHFIELQRDTEGFLWIMIHSGSRNLGYKVAEHYNHIAKKENASWYSQIDPAWDLAFLPVHSKAGHQYIKEMQYCIDFALANRQLMMSYVQEAVSSVLNETDYTPMINIAHNYAAFEEHFGEQVVVHRKGATSARLGETGIISGSQGTKSYIVEGLGNPESFMSCSHGAGRTMSRTKAIRELDLEEEKKKLDDQGIIHSIRGKKDLEEASSAYKNIAEVMALQADLVRIKVELSPLAVIKG